MERPFSYDEVADAYARQVDTAPYNAHYERPAMLAMLPPVDGRAVLDAGCGTGWYAEQLLARGAQVTGVDGSAAMLTHARRRLGERVPLLHHDLTQPLPFPDEAFDLVLCPLVLHYLRDPRPTLREFRRVLRPGGRLLLSTHHPCHEADRLETLGRRIEYFATEQVEEVWDSVGAVRFYRRPLSALFEALAGAGMLVERVAEPKPTAEFKRVKPETYEALLRRPEFLLVLATKLS